MTIKRRDFQKAASLIHEFQLKLNEGAECAELRDALNLALLHMQRYYRKLRSRVQQNQEKQASNGSSLLTQSLRGLSPMTPFRDTPDKFQWKWVNLESPKLSNTLPADLNKELSSLPAIILAAKEGDNYMLMQHIERDPDCVFEVDAIGRNALMYAVNQGHLDTVQILLENGIEPNAIAHDGSTAVHRACHEGNHEALQILTGYNANLEIQDTQGRYPIHWACAHPSRDCLKVLLDKSVDVTVRDHDGLTPSMWACRMDNISHFELLTAVENQLVQEEDGFERDNCSRTWMHWSVRRTEPLECLKTLLTEDSASLKDDEGKTVILSAAEMGSLAAIKIVIDIAGKEVLDQRDGSSRTALILATMGGHGEVVNYLLTVGADLACVDDTGATAWDYACNRQLHYCMLILASYIRQRAKTESETGDEGGPSTRFGEDTLGLNHLQINGEDNPLLYGHRPIPPPHPPGDPPITPRTPRRPKTPATPRGVYTREGQNYGSQQTLNPPKDPSVPAGNPRGQGGVKRSPSTPDPNEVDAFFQRNTHKPSSASNKRIKSEESPDREGLMSVMSVESPGRMSSRGASSNSGPHTPANQDAVDQEPEIANDSQYADGADDDHSRVSIDAMDVSDFDEDAEPEEEVNAAGQAPNHRKPRPQYQTDPSPRPPPQPNPRQSTPPSPPGPPGPPPYSYAPKPGKSQQNRKGRLDREADRKKKATGQTSGPYYNTHAQPAAANGSGDYDGDVDVDEFGDSPEPAYSREPHSQGGAPMSDNRAPPPAHLTPIQPGAAPPPAGNPPKKKKKKKKKERPEVEGYGDFGEQNKGYVAPIPPPLHPSHPPPAPQPRPRSPPRGGVRGGGLSGSLQANVRPNSGAMKPTPQKRSQSLGAEQEQRYRGLSGSSQMGQQPQQQDFSGQDGDDYGQGQGHMSRQDQRPSSGKKLQPFVPNGGLSSGGQTQAQMMPQNGPVGQRSQSLGRREPSPAPRDKHPPSPRERRPPSGSLGGSMTKQNPPWTKKQMPNGRLPPSYNN